MNIKKFSASLLIGTMVMLQSPIMVIAQEVQTEPVAEVPTPTPTLTYREQLRSRSETIINSYYERYGVEPTVDTNEPEVEEKSVQEEEILPTEQYPEAEMEYVGDDPSATNAVTQKDSVNIADAHDENTEIVENTNETEHQTTVEGNLDSGFNGASSITGETHLESGDANASFSETNTYNTNTTQTTGENPTLTNTGNSITGSDSTNIATASDTDLTEITNANDLELIQDAEFDVNTGFNLLESNNGENSITSGDANVSVNLVNFANSNINADAVLKTENYDIYDEKQGDLVIDFDNYDGSTGLLNDFDNMKDVVVAANDTTQGGSLNDSLSTDSTKTVITNINEADVEQNVDILVNTGGNVADMNNGDTTINTGDANVAANIINFVNTNLNNVTDFLVGTVNVFGDMVGNIVLPGTSADSQSESFASDSVESSNSNTGAHTLNVAESASETALLITNENDLESNTSIETLLTTGNNEVEAVNGPVTVNSGNVDTSIHSATVANQNVNGGDDETFYLIIVNNLGDWAGEMMGFDGDNYAVVDASQLDSYEASLNASNDTTLGDLNLATSTKSDETIIENINDAEIETNLYIDANTGSNYAGSINGATTINTGDIKASANTVNFANFNFTGKKVVVSVVNIFGSLMGNIVDSVTSEELKAQELAEQKQNIESERAIGSPIDNVGTESNVTATQEQDNDENSDFIDDETTSNDENEKSVSPETTEVVNKYPVLGSTSTNIQELAAEILQEKNETVEDDQLKEVIQAVSDTQQVGKVYASDSGEVDSNQTGMPLIPYAGAGLAVLSMLGVLITLGRRLI